MISIDEVEALLDEVAEEMPAAFYEHLNGGVLLLPQEKLHPQRRADDFYILGEYHHTLDMGKFIVIYYGSFARVYGHLTPERLRDELKRVLIHEFTHHVERLAGERELEKKDARDLDRYWRRWNRS